MTEEMTEKVKYENEILVGVDVGSTTTKIAVLDRYTCKILHFDYQRHHAEQVKSVIKILKDILHKYDGRKAYIAFAGSGAKPAADRLGVPFVQEVVANAIALKRDYGTVRTAIELGGQDAKIIFFNKDEKTGNLNVRDMRMNGSCAGGTGAFIDEMASVLKIAGDEFDKEAAKGTCVYDISGRCGVYAKTDIQPLLNQGAAKSDLALSSFHAIAKQTIGGLAQGLDIEKPVAFEGGPLTFNPTLIRVFAERLDLKEDDIIIPEHPEIMVAYGAALYLEDKTEELEAYALSHYIDNLEKSLETQHEEVLQGQKFFETDEEKEEFLKRHEKSPVPHGESIKEGERAEVYLGIDSGSTTTKLVLMDRNEEIIDCFYAANDGEPLDVAKKAILEIYERYQKRNIDLKILAAGVTGYGEILFSKAFNTEYHMVETVAHARAADKYEKDASFILDIGGQDMKAIWLDNGVITNIVVNEACSSGCGSFLENFASSLKVDTKDIARLAFESENPAVLGSRCTVFMNSSIITEQRNGKKVEDIMAGLCRSIIENVFTKVIRMSNLSSLGSKIVVQGGTFENDAVLRTVEQYIGKPVCRAPYPGLMGAIGAALVTKEGFEADHPEQTFISFDELKEFTYEQDANMPCPFCANHCKRTVIKFSNGTSWVTNNRCERGEILGNPEEQSVRDELKNIYNCHKQVTDMFQIRQELLFKEFPYEMVDGEKNITIGLPRVLFYWETMPFWSTLWQSLGFDVEISPKSTRKMYENGLSAVASDTVCFPAKLVHGHIRSLIKMGVDRIFMPSVMTVESENQESSSQSMCAVVKGYPLVIKNSDNPADYADVPFDNPLFYWPTDADRNTQLKSYMKEQFGIVEKITEKAIAEADKAQNMFRSELKHRGAQAIEDVKAKGKYAVVLAARPYHNDFLVNHEISKMFTEKGITVLTADCLPELEQIELKNSRLDIVNNYHARVISSAVMTAREEWLEFVQVVSFGCGHDAYLSDEAARILSEASDKTPLILKLDESDIKGPLSIRVRSFIETVNMRRKSGQPKFSKLEEPYKVKFTKDFVKEKVVLVPNTSHAFSRIMAAAMKTQDLKTIPLEIGREEAIRLGKKYTHNDICFPAQIVIGEILAALESGEYDIDNTAVAMAKYLGDCRLTHYSALLRKAMDDAGFEKVPILTNDDKDDKNMHPGFKMSLMSSIRIALALPMIDAYEELLRKMRPYEKVKGSANEAFEKAMDALVEGIESGSFLKIRSGFKKGIEIMKAVEYDRTTKRPGVLIVGEYLLNFHPGANHDIEDYLEKHGFEIIEARMADVIRKTYFAQESQMDEYKLKVSLKDRAWLKTTNAAFEVAHNITESVAKAHPLYEKATRLKELVKGSDPIIYHTFDAGEGVLIPGEIIHHAKRGCRAAVILQPFGCLPNHVVGRGVAKKLKEMYPDMQILPLDYDPDVSFANIENRLQMLVMNK